MSEEGEIALKIGDRVRVDVKAAASASASDACKNERKKSSGSKGKGEQQTPLTPPPNKGDPTGVIAFLGETRFAKGEWAGIVLDAEFVANHGKNDGAVKGTRYFQTDPRRGLFTRISKLTKLASPPPSPKKRRSSSSTDEVKPRTSDSCEKSQVEGVVEQQGEEREEEEEALTPDSNGGGAGSVDSGVESPRNSASPEPPAATQQQQQHSSSATNSKSPSYAKATKSFKVKQKDAIPSGTISVVKTTKSVSSSRKTSPPSSLLLQQELLHQELLHQEQQRPTCDAGESSVTVDDSSSFPVDGGLEDSASIHHLCAAADEKALSSVPMADTIGDCADLLDEAAPESESGRSNSTVKEIDVSVGDRVLVSKTRKGFVRFVGPTEFAAGIWVGVELEEPRGKNNGTVDGKKYFNCKGPFHGIFTSPDKVIRIDSAGRKIQGRGLSSKSQTKDRNKTNLPRSSSRESLASISSMSSISSIISNVSNRSHFVAFPPPPPFSAQDRKHSAPAHSAANSSKGPAIVKPVVPNATPPVGRKPIPSSTTSSACPLTRSHSMRNKRTTSLNAKEASATMEESTLKALRETLEEKTQHIDQLLMERDMERSEVAKATMEAEESETRLNALRTEFNEYKLSSDAELARLQGLVDSSEDQRRLVNRSLEEKRRENEDWVFRFEEMEMKFGEEVDKAVEEKTALKKTLESEEKMNIMFNRELEELKEELRKLQEEMSVALFREEEQKNLVSELEEKLAAKEAEMNAFNPTTTAVINKLEDEEKINVEIEKLRRLLKAEEEGTSLTSSSALDMMTALKMGVTSTAGADSEMVDNLQKQVQTLQMQLSQSTERTEGSLEELKRQLSESNERLKEKDFHIHEMSCKLETMEQQCRDKLIQREIELLQKLENYKSVAAEEGKEKEISRKLREEKSDLENGIARLTAEKSRLMNELKESNSLFQTTNEKLTQTQLKLKEMENDRRVPSASSSTTTNSTKDFLEIQISAKDFEILSLEERMSDLGKSLADANDLSESLQRELDAVQDEFDRQASELEERLFAEERKTVNAEEVMVKAREENERLVGELTALRDSTREWEKEKISLESEITERDRRVTEAGGQLDDLRNKIADANDREKRSQRRCAELETLLMESRDDAEILTDNLEDAKNREETLMKTLEDKMRENQKELDLAKKACLQWKEKNDELRESLLEEREKVAQAQEEIQRRDDSLQKWIASTNEKDAELQKWISLANEKEAELQKWISLSNEKDTELQKFNSTAKDEAEVTKKLGDSLAAKINDLELALYDKSEELETTRDKYSGLERKSTSQREAMRLKDEEIGSLKEEMTMKEEEMKTLNKRVDDLEKEAETFRAIIEKKANSGAREEADGRETERWTEENRRRIGGVDDEDHLCEVVSIEPEKSTEQYNHKFEPNLVNGGKEKEIDVIPSEDDLVNFLREENDRLRSELNRLKKTTSVDTKDVQDGDDPSVPEPHSETALVPTTPNIDPNGVSTLSPTNAAVLDSYILSQSPMFYFLAQHLESSDMPKFDHKWSVGIGGESALDFTATWTPPPSSSVGDESIDGGVALPLVSSSSSSLAATPVKGASTPKNVATSKRVWTITPLLMPKQKINKKSLRAKLRERHLQRIKAQLMDDKTSSTTSLPAFMPSSCLTRGTSSNASTDELFLHIPNLASITSTPGRNTPSAALSAGLASSVAANSRLDAGVVVDRGDLKGVVQDQLGRGLNLSGELNDSFAAVIRLQESIYLLRHRVDKCYSSSSNGSGK